MNGSIPGDAPALVDVYVTPSGGAATPIFAALGWWNRAPLFNRCWNGDFENALLAADIWSNAVVTNITAGSTSITRITTAAKFGVASGQIVTPATLDSGASFRIFRQFKKGVTYTAEAWIHSAAGVTNTYIRLGNGAANDKATSGNTALSTTWQKITIAWTPTADRDDAHVAVNIAAATATTFEIDGVMVYEGTTAPTSANQSEGRGGVPPLGLIEAEAFRPSITSDAGSRSGFRADALGNGSLFVNVVVDPALLLPDDFSQGELAIEVWARFLLTTTSTMVRTYAQPLSSTSNLPITYAEEFGSAGRVPTKPSSGTAWRINRLGTLRLSADAGRWLVTVDATLGAGAGGALDYIILLPSAARALSPSGRANDSGYPAFAPASSEITKKIRSDLSATLKETASGSPEVRTHGLGGTLLEFPQGNVDTVVKLSSLVPDDPTSNTATEQLAHSATIHYAVTPRYMLARSS